jgi:hypothetical protein
MSMCPAGGWWFQVKFARRRGVSEVLGAMLVAMMAVAISVAYVAAGGLAARQQALSFVDVVRAAERAQRQLLSLTYYYRSEGCIHLFIYNYGSDPSTPERLVIAGAAYVRGAGSYAYNMTLAGDSARHVDAIDPRQLVELTATPAPEADEFEVALATAEGGVFVWKLQF